MHVRKKHEPDGYMMVSFDVKLLFTYAPLQTTIDINLEKISEWDEINTFISQTEMN